MAIRPSQAKFSIPPPPWNTDMSLGQRTQHFKARYVNTAFEKPVAYNFFWLQQNKSLFQKTLEKTSSTLIDLRYIKCSWYIAVNFLLFYRGYIIKVAFEKNKTENKKLTLPPAVRKFHEVKMVHKLEWEHGVVLFFFFFWSGFCCCFFPLFLLNLVIYFQIKTSKGLRYCLQPIQLIVLQKTLPGMTSE